MTYSERLQVYATIAANPTSTYNRGGWDQVLLAVFTLGLPYFISATIQVFSR